MAEPIKMKLECQVIWVQRTCILHGNVGNPHGWTNLTVNVKCFAQRVAFCSAVIALTLKFLVLLIF